MNLGSLINDHRVIGLCDYAHRPETIVAKAHEHRGMKNTSYSLRREPPYKNKITLQIRKDLKGYFAIVVPGGFEPPLTEPKTVVLPLHHRTIKPTAKVVDFFSTTKLF